MLRSNISLKKQFPSFGIEIGARMVRCVVVDETKRGATVRRVLEGHLPKGAVEAGLLQDADRVAAAIREALASEHHHFPRYVIASIPDQLSYVFLFTLPATGQPNLVEAIRWEAGQHLPYGIDEMYLDWKMVSEDGHRAIVQVAASPKTAVDAYIAMLEKAGLTPIALETSSLAALQSLALPPDRACMVLLIGWSSTTLVYVSPRGVPMTLVSPVFCGERLTLALVERLKLKPGEAEKAKVVCGLDPACSQGVVRHALWPEWKLLFDEITRLRAFTHEYDPNASCQDLLLTGSHSSVRFLQEELRLKTQMTVAGTSLRSDLQFAEKNGRPVLRADDIPAFTCAMGLAVSPL